MIVITRDYYSEIDKGLKEYENNKPYHTRTIEWLTNRIAWCWRWKKITEAQMTELADRIIKVMEGDI